MEKRTTLLAVGMLPPPIGGQALMFERAIKTLGECYDLKVIDIQLQRNLGESGSFSLRKVLSFFAIFFVQIAPLAFKPKYDILYYCLSSGESTFGAIKDLILLGFLRPRARKTVYHFHGAGGVQFIMHTPILRVWAHLVLFKPDLVLYPLGGNNGDTSLCEAKLDMPVANGIEDPIAIIPELSNKSSEEGLSFTFIGLITEDKGVFDLVSIARLLRASGYEFKMNIVGEGSPDEIARLRNLIHQYNLADFVRLTGVLIGREKFELLQKTTIFVFPTYFRAETQPTAIMEALAVGVPVVASDWRGINTIIDNGVNGYIVSPRDPASFCHAIITILTSGQMDSMRIAARRIFLERFTLDHHTKALRQAFRLLEHDSDNTFHRNSRWRRCLKFTD